MSFDNLFHVTHSAEDLFSLIRDNGGECTDWADIFDIILVTIDFTKKELMKIQAGQPNDGDPASLISRMEEHLKLMERQENSLPALNSPGGAAGCVHNAGVSQHPCYKIKMFLNLTAKWKISGFRGRCGPAEAVFKNRSHP